MKQELAAIALVSIALFLSGCAQKGSDQNATMPTDQNAQTTDQNKTTDSNAAQQPSDQNAGQCTPQWHCSNWGECSAAGKRTRQCISEEACFRDKPAEEESCTPTTSPADQNAQATDQNNATGQSQSQQQPQPTVSAENDLALGAGKNLAKNTVGWAMAAALEEAKKWHSDAYLQSILSYNVSNDGTSPSWQVMFYSNTAYSETKDFTVPKPRYQVLFNLDGISSKNPAAGTDTNALKNVLANSDTILPDAVKKYGAPLSYLTMLNGKKLKAGYTTSTIDFDPATVGDDESVYIAKLSETSSAAYFYSARTGAYLGKNK